MNWAVVVAKSARKKLAEFPAKDRSRILAGLESMAVDPFYGDIVRLEAKGDRWRRRIGEYRVFFSVDKTSRIVVVSAIERRTSTTY